MIQMSLKHNKLGNTRKMGAGNKSKTVFSFFLFHKKKEREKKQAESVGRWETKHFMGMA
jgi:hypothetical protein